MKQIFVGGAFFTTKKEDTDVFPFVVNIIKENIKNAKVIQPTDIEVYRENVKKNNPDILLQNLNKAMVDYDLNLIKTSDLFIADVTNKSIGLGLELGVAWENNVTVELVARTGANISNMVFGAFPYNKVSYYSTLQDLENIIKDILKKYN